MARRKNKGKGECVRRARQSLAPICVPKPSLGTSYDVGCALRTLRANFSKQLLMGLGPPVNYEKCVGRASSPASSQI
jgi:hypothetical protein